VLAEKAAPPEVKPMLFAIGRQRRDVGLREVGHDVFLSDLLDSHG
jgi:hypothetical protein